MCVMYVSCMCCVCAVYVSPERGPRAEPLTAPSADRVPLHSTPRTKRQGHRPEQQRETEPTEEKGILEQQTQKKHKPGNQQAGRAVTYRVPRLQRARKLFVLGREEMPKTQRNSRSCRWTAPHGGTSKFEAGGGREERSQDTACSTRTKPSHR